ncbi:MAG: GumC family protein [Candidatus Glassbacteria bacterium]
MKGIKTPSDYIDVIKRRRRTIGAIMISALTVSFLLSLLLPKHYESQVTFYLPTYQAQQVALTGKTRELVRPRVPIPISSNVTIQGILQILLSRTVAEKVASEIPGRTPEAIRTNATMDVSKEGIFKIKVRDSDPEIASRVANTYPKSASHFLETTTTIGAGAGRLKTFIEDQIERVRARTDSTEEALRHFLGDHEVISVNKEIEKLINLDANLRTQKLTTQVLMLENSVKMEALTEQMNLAGADAIEHSLGTNEVVLQLRAKAASLEIRIAELKQTYTEEHPEIIALRAALQETQDMLKKEIEKIFDSYSEPINPIVGKLKEDYIDLQIKREVLLSKNDILDTAVENLADGFQDLTQIQYDFVKLKRESLMLNRLNNSLALKLEEIKFQEQQEGARFVILDEAKVRRTPAYPKTTINLLVSLTLSLLVGILMCLIWESREARRRERVMEEMTAEDLRGVFLGE